MLIDDLLWGFSVAGDKTGLAQMLRYALCFQVDNVAAYAYESLLSVDEKGEKFRDIEDVRKHIPNVAPLAPVMWFEFGGLAKAANKPASNRYGCLLSVEYDREMQYLEEEQVSKIPENTRWILRSQCFGKVADGYKLMNWIHYIAVAEDGGLCDFLGCEPSALHIPDQSTPSHFYNEALVALIAICFSHCKGTQIKEWRPSRQVRRAAERTGKPIYTFHTIDIQPSTHILRTEGRISENGLAKALHICRGHFAHYTAEKPLFGKHTGTFYRPMHLRGSQDAGVVEKDYRIKTC